MAIIAFPGSLTVYYFKYLRDMEAGVACFATLTKMLIFTLYLEIKCHLETPSHYQ